MIKIEEANKFLSGSYGTAILTESDNEVSLFFTLDDITYFGNLYNFEESYDNYDLLAQKFLETNIIQGINYRTKIPKFFDYNCIAIKGSNNKLVLASKFPVFKAVPSIVEKIEAKKREDTLKLYESGVNSLEFKDNKNVYITEVKLEEKKLTLSLLKYKVDDYTTSIYANDIKLMGELVKRYALDNNFYDYTLKFNDYFKEQFSQTKDKVYFKIQINEDRFIEVNSFELYNIIMGILNEVYFEKKETLEQMSLERK